MDLTNNNKENIYNNKYTPDYILLDSSDKEDFHDVETSITHLETRGIRILFYLLKEIKSSDKGIEINLTIYRKNIYIKLDRNNKLY